MHNSHAFYVITYVHRNPNEHVNFISTLVKQICFREIINLVYYLPGRFSMGLIWTLDGYRETLVFML